MTSKAFTETIAYLRHYLFIYLFLIDLCSVDRLRYNLCRHLALDLLCEDDHLAPDLATGLFVWRDQRLRTVALKALD